MSADERDGLRRREFHQRQQEVAWHKAPHCGTKGPHGARCCREPGHGGRWCEGNGNPDRYGPSFYRWKRLDVDAAEAAVIRAATADPTPQTDTDT
jgi:hypothetical protein